MAGSQQGLPTRQLLGVQRAQRASGNLCGLYTREQTLGQVLSEGNHHLEEGYQGFWKTLVIVTCRLLKHLNTPKYKSNENANVVANLSMDKKAPE